MIRYDMRCVPAGHGFDGWFRSSADFDAQSARGLLACPVCGATEVEKALMAPSVATRRDHAPASEAAAEPVALVEPREQKLRDMLRDLRREITKNSEDVGERFPEVARKMHAEEIEQRTIHGRATAKEAEALAEEGVPIQPLPGFPDELN